MKIKLCREGAKIPTYATPGAACFDIYAVVDGSVYVWLESAQEINTGLQFEIPEGFALMVYSRSGHGFNSSTRLANCVGVIDSDYRGELKIKLIRDEGMFEPLIVKHGDRVAQGMLIPVNQVTFEQVDELNTTTRGSGGFGSTGE